MSNALNPQDIQNASDGDVEFTGDHPRKRQKRHTLDGSVVVPQGSTAQAKQNWDHKSYRVSRIPASFDALRLSGAVMRLFDLEDSEFKIHSMATDASDEAEPPWRVATLSFRSKPAALQVPPGSQEEWTFILPSPTGHQPSAAAVTFDTHFWGFTPLSSTEFDNQHRIDCIFIHGWGGYALGSFKSSKDAHVWPRDSLPRHFPQLRVWTYGYNSNLQEPDRTADVLDFARLFRQQLLNLRRKTKAKDSNTPLIFVAHSLGGWVFKKAIIEMQKSSDDDAKACLQSIYGAIFFGVPTEGMETEALRSMVGGYPSQFTLNLLDSQLGFEFRRSLHQDFCSAFDLKNSKIFYFYEEKKSPTVVQNPETKTWSRGGPKILLVSPESATQGRPCDTGSDCIGSIEADHSGMVKFSEHDRAYERVRPVVKSFAENAQEAIKSRAKISADSDTLDRSDTAVLGREDREWLWRLCQSNPRDDKKRIEQTKGGLLKDSYRWILENDTFQQWCKDDQSRLLWIKGDPGKGKTMLLCGIIDEITKRKSTSGPLLSYFFCQATDSRINSAMGVLRGLIYLLIDQQPSLISHLRDRYDQKSGSLFDDANTWVVLSDIFAGILHNPNLPNAFVIVDALDECVADRRKLLDLIGRLSSSVPGVKWIVSSRNWPEIEERLRESREKQWLPLELNEDSISVAVRKYVIYKVQDLAHVKQYDEKTKSSLEEYLVSNAKETFLWVALVCENLQEISQWDTLDSLTEFPPGLDSVYQQMIQRLCQSKDVSRLKRILATVTIAYRPVTLLEMATLVGLPTNIVMLEGLIKLCGSFLTIREGTVYLVHQSAKDFLLDGASNEIFSSGAAIIHHQIYSRSIEILLEALHRDLYQLRHPGIRIEHAQRPTPDPLAKAEYSCIYWVDHLELSLKANAVESELCNGGTVDQFLRTKYLYWLEALSLLKGVSSGVLSITKLQHIIQGQADTSPLTDIIRDARRFILYYRNIIEERPLQTYVSALLFSPANSLIKKAFAAEHPQWVTVKTGLESDWPACLQTLEGHSGSVWSVAFSPDDKLLASGSGDFTVKLWDPMTGSLLKTLESHSRSVNSVAFSLDGQLASGSDDETIKLWGPTTGALLKTLKSHENHVGTVAFSSDGQLASGSGDKTIKLWDAATGRLLQTLKGHSAEILTIAFSPNGTLASGSKDTTIRLWNPRAGKLLQILEGHSDRITSVAFSPNGQLASGDKYGEVKLWDIEGVCRQTFDVTFFQLLRGVAFSPDGNHLASGSGDSVVRLSDTTTGRRVRTLEGHSSAVPTVGFSSTGQLASGSVDGTIKLWDITDSPLQMSRYPFDPLSEIAFSPDGRRLVTGSGAALKLWDATTGKVLLTFKEHQRKVGSFEFSPDGKQLAYVSSGLFEKFRIPKIEIWDTTTWNHLHALEVSDTDFSRLFFSPNGNYLASLYERRRPIIRLPYRQIFTTMLWDLTAGSLVRTSDCSSLWGVPSATAFSPDSKKMAFGSSEDIEIWETTTGRDLDAFQDSFRAKFVAFSPDGSQLAAQDDYEISLWSTTTRRKLHTLRSCDTPFIFSPDSKQLAAASDSPREIWIWDTSTGCFLKKIKLDESIRQLFFYRDPRYLKSDRGLIRIEESESDDFWKSRQKCRLFAKEDWITQDCNEVVWLPPEYRLSYFRKGLSEFIVSDNRVTLVFGSGKIVIIAFDFSRKDW